MTAAHKKKLSNTQKVTMTGEPSLPRNGGVNSRDSLIKGRKEEGEREFLEERTLGEPSFGSHTQLEIFGANGERMTGP